jgi:SAM-dependent methyltransferase
VRYKKGDVVQQDVWQNIWEHQDVSLQGDLALIEYELQTRRWSQVLNTLENHKASFPNPNSPAVIELGSGIGDASLILAKKLHASITLIDNNDLVLSKARKRFDTHGFLAKAINFDFLKDLPEEFCKQYDISISLGVAEHFQYDERIEVFRKHFTVLRPGGITVISVPNRLSWPYRYWKWNLERQEKWIYGFEKPFSPRELHQFAKAVGFVNISISGSSFYEALYKYLLVDRPRLRNILMSILGGQIRKSSVVDSQWGYSLTLIAQRPK